MWIRPLSIFCIKSEALYLEMMGYVFQTDITGTFVVPVVYEAEYTKLFCRWLLDHTNLSVLLCGIRFVGVHSRGRHRIVGQERDRLIGEGSVLGLPNGM